MPLSAPSGNARQVEMEVNPMAELLMAEMPRNEMDQLLTYGPGTPEREQLIAALESIKGEYVEIPLIIGDTPVRTGRTTEVRPPHDYRRALAKAHLAGEVELLQAIELSRRAHVKWSAMDVRERADIFRDAADILAGPKRIEMIAAIMIDLSKTPYEAEIDLIELVDFWRFNAYYAEFLHEQQPGQWVEEHNRFDWRPLEGFVAAVTPFNFVAIAGNLPSAPAMVGNVVIWKPSRSVLLSNYRIMPILQQPGLPDGVINFMPFESSQSKTLFNHRSLAGLHFTGSSETLLNLWQRISANLGKYRSFPRVVGEAGGKDFMMVHRSADPLAVAANAIRGAFEYQGQKCSAASRMYVPESLWDDIRSLLLDEIPNVRYGPVDGLNVAMGSIINQAAFDKVKSYIQFAKNHANEYEVIYGGRCDDTDGWFVELTLVVTTSPKGKLITEEIFGPVLTILVYPDEAYEGMLHLCNETTAYGLTGSIFARDDEAIKMAEDVLRFAAGNFYINDKPSGSIVNRQPFGGGRRSGTNDKSGHWLNLTRWMSPRTIKEALNPALLWQRPYMK